MHFVVVTTAQSLPLNLLHSFDAWLLNLPLQFSVEETDFDQRSVQYRGVNVLQLAKRCSVMYAEEKEEKEEHSILPKAHVTRICILAHQGTVDEAIAACDQ